MMTGGALVCAVRHRSERRAGRRPLTPALAVAGAVLAAAVVVSSLVVSAQTLGRMPADAVRAYVEGGRDAAAAPGGIDLVDGPVPRDVMSRGFFVDDARASVVLGPLPVPPRFGRPTADLRVLDAAGAPRIPDIEVFAVTPSSDAACPFPVGPVVRTLPVEPDLGEGRWVVRVGYYSASPTTGRLRVDDRRYHVELLAGLHYLYVEVVGEIRGVALGGLADGARVCVTDVAIGTAVPSPGG